MNDSTDNEAQLHMTTAAYAGTQQHEATTQPAYWSGVFAMTLCVFALIASEFMPVSLLTPMAADCTSAKDSPGKASRSPAHSRCSPACRFRRLPAP
jgi:hypothetical protein